MLRGYTVGGTVHVIVNNLIGFTSNPSEAYSSRFSSDLAKRLPIPIFHVNGEDPDAVVRVGRMAFEYRYEFGTDVVVDLIGFRRHGHSEVDDPTITQPILYRKIKDRPLLYLSYAERVGMDPQPFVEKFQAELDAAQKAGKSMSKKPVMRQLPSYWAPYHGGEYKPCRRSRYRTSGRRVAAHYRPPDHVSRGLPHPSQGAKAAGAAPRDGIWKAPARLRHGRSTGLRIARAARNAHPPQRTGQPSRHL